MINKKQTKRISYNGIKFALDFSQMDLQSIRKGDILNLREELRDFVSGKLDGETGSSESLIQGNCIQDEGDLETIDLDYLISLQQTIKDFFLMCINSSNNKDFNRSSWKKLTVTIDIGVSEYAIGGSSVCLYGQVSPMFLFRLLEYGRRGVLSKLRECPICKRIFLKIGKKEYCSLKCTYRAVNLRRQTE